MRAPLLDDRDREALVREVLARHAGYTRGWEPGAGTAAGALVQIVARYLELLGSALNEAPERGFHAFLDMLGVARLPAQPARAPLVFTLLDNSPADVPLPPNTQVAVRATPRLPSALGEPAATAASPAPVVFTASQTITLARARLTALYSVQPDTDEYIDHSASITSGLSIFERWTRADHTIYLGHDHLFNLPHDADLIISMTFASAVGSARGAAVALDWEYLSADGWRSLVQQRTAGIAADGQYILRKSCGPPSRKDTLQGRESYWLRAHLTTPLPPEGTDRLGALPLVDTIRARVGYRDARLRPDAAFTDGFRVDLSGAFRPFGPQPAQFTTFSIARRDVFQRPGARIQMAVVVGRAGRRKPVKPPPADDPGATEPGAVLAWEYFNGTAWVSIGAVADSTEAFTRAGSGLISFVCPPDWAEIEVAGESNLWLRARIAQGDYGTPLQPRVDAAGTITGVDPSTIEAPVITAITFGYVALTDPEPVDHCLTSNNFVFEDHTQDSLWPRATFAPFRPLPDRYPAVYLGFDRGLPQGLVSLYVHVSEGEDAHADTASAFIWEYLSSDGWTELGTLDETGGFRTSGTIQFVGPDDALASPGIGGELYRVRARLKPGERPDARPIDGIWINAVWSSHGTAVQYDQIGTSDGHPNQALRFAPQRPPILEGETIELREWTGAGRGWESVVAGVPSEDLRFETDRATGTITAVWVRWHARAHLYDSHAGDRHYTLDRAFGVLRFGDGVHGLIPAAGSLAAATYTSGGGLTGNVAAGAIAELRTAVPYVMAVANPAPATGGAETEAIDAVQGRGAQRIRHRQRALAAGDVEWLAREATPAVARASCLPVTGPAGRVQRGWITLVVVPYSESPQPQPDVELRRRIRRYLTEHATAAVGRRIRVLGPTYLAVSVDADLVPVRAEDAGLVEARVRQRLNAFLHPLTGGRNRTGWLFGEPVYLSQIAEVIEGTPGVDFARRIALKAGDAVFGDVLPGEAGSLVSAGPHALKLTIGRE